MQPEAVGGNSMRRIQNTLHKIKRKIYRLMHLITAGIPVIETIIVLAVLILLLLVFRSLIVKCIASIIFR